MKLKEAFEIIEKVVGNEDELSLISLFSEDKKEWSIRIPLYDNGVLTKSNIETIEKAIEGTKLYYWINKEHLEINYPSD